MTILYNQKQWEFVRKLNLMGYSYTELAEWLHVHPTTVQLGFNRHDLHDVKRPPLSIYTEQLNALGGDD